MLSSSLDTLLKFFNTTSPPKLFAYDCIPLKNNFFIMHVFFYVLPYSLPESSTDIEKLRKKRKIVIKHYKPCFAMIFIKRSPNAMPDF